jgi:bacteriorhodopsin
MSNNIVYNSALGSLISQVILGIFTSIGFFAGVPKHLEDDLLPIFMLELSSQLIEFAWYLIVVCKYRDITTWTRYIDWFFSTPVMLISTTLFFLHRSNVSYDDFLQSGRFYMMIMFNWLMLSFGFALELNAIPKIIGLSFGSAMLVASFSVMASFLQNDELSIGLFVAMCIVWALYGVAAAFPYKEKNVAYNVLDIVSKNLYGVFLTIYSFTI